MTQTKAAAAVLAAINNNTSKPFKSVVGTAIKTAARALLETTTDKEKLVLHRFVVLGLELQGYPVPDLTREVLAEDCPALELSQEPQQPAAAIEPTSEPVAWCRSDDFAASATKQQSFSGWRQHHFFCDVALYASPVPAPATPETPAEALAARPLLEQVAAMADCIGAHTVSQITAISNRAAAWLRENPPGQPVSVEPRGCPVPGACSCVEPAPLAVPAKDLRVQGFDVKRLAARLDELSDSVTQGPDSVRRNFTMRVPAEPYHDADLVLSAAASLLRNWLATSKGGATLPLRNCRTHGQQGPEAWGCPECVRELREELATAREALRRLVVWGGSSASRGLSSAVVIAVADWFAAGMTAPLPPLPSYIASREGAEPTPAAPALPATGVDG